MTVALDKDGSVIMRTDKGFVLLDAVAIPGAHYEDEFNLNVGVVEVYGKLTVEP